MARLPSDAIGPASSTGSPITFMMRPSVPTPTGTMIGLPVSLTSWPRTRPSVVSMAMVRTVDSPRCWATSSTSRLPPFLVSIAFKMAGKCPSNCTSTTAPMTCVMRPVWLADVAMKTLSFEFYLKRPLRLSDRLGAGDDFNQLLGDHRLPGSIVDQRLLANHVAGVAGGIVHRAHLGAVERGVVFQQRAEDLHRQIARQQAGQNLVFFRLIFVRRRRAGIRGPGFDHQRNDLLRSRNLRDHRLEARIEQRADIELAGLEASDDLVRNVLGVDEAELANRAQLDVFDDLLFEVAAQLLKTLAADAEELDLFALVDQRQRALAGQPHDRGIERAGQAALAGADQQQMHLILAGAGQQHRQGSGASAAGLHRRARPVRRVQFLDRAAGPRARAGADQPGQRGQVLLRRPQGF